MKRSFYIIASLLLLAGCSDTLSVEGQLIPDGEMAVNLKLEGPMAGPGTRSMPATDCRDARLLGVLPEAARRSFLRHARHHRCRTHGRGL